MGLGNRLHKAMKGKGITQEKLGELLGVKSGTISYRLRNDAFKDHDIDFICRSFGISIKWVKQGKGDMYASNPPEEYGDHKSGVHSIEDRSANYFSLLGNDKLSTDLDKDKNFTKKALIERIYDLESKLMEAIHGERVATTRERDITDRYLDLLEKREK